MFLSLRPFSPTFATQILMLGVFPGHYAPFRISALPRLWALLSSISSLLGWLFPTSLQWECITSSTLNPARLICCEAPRPHRSVHSSFLCKVGHALTWICSQPTPGEAVSRFSGAPSFANSVVCAASVCCVVFPLQHKR